ncbi:MAG: glycosyltransferase [Bacilli bacterium]|nr:glycosyltransferase [Bacilli bacterium]
MKILFLQNKGKSYGGVWQVNKMVGEALINEGYDVRVVSIRENHTDITVTHDPRMIVETINTKDIWETYSYRDIIKDIFNIKDFLKKLKSRLKNNFSLKKDIQKLHQYIFDYKPDYIVTSHYQLLKMIPKTYLCKTFHEQHLAFRDSWAHKATRKALLKYKNKVKYIWLCKTTYETALTHGLSNSYYIYNAVRFETNQIADVNQNQKLITIVRLSEEKRIDLMTEIVNEIFQDPKYNDWTFEIYGDGPTKELIESKIKSSRIKLMGKTDNPQDKLLNASINLNTSAYEGFSLSILEANECGIPTISLDFGESVKEEIIDGKTGFIAKNKDDYIKKLTKLMDDQTLLKDMSLECKNYNSKFRIKNIVNDWKKLFK